MQKKTKTVIADPVTLLIEINESLINFARRGQKQPLLRLPPMIDLAYLVHHTAGTITMEEIATEGDSSSSSRSN